MKCGVMTSALCLSSDFLEKSLTFAFRILEGSRVLRSLLEFFFCAMISTPYLAEILMGKS